MPANEGRSEDEGWRLRKDGSRFWANAVITRLRDAKGELLGFGAFIRDMTRHRQAETERLRAVPAEERLRFRTEFLRDAAHELRTPLTPLGLQLDSLRRHFEASGSPDEVGRADIAIATRQAEHLGASVQSLLENSWSRGPAKNRPPSGPGPYGHTLYEGLESHLPGGQQ